MWVSGNYQRINGGFHAFGAATSDCPEGWVDDGAGGCNRDPSYQLPQDNPSEPMNPTQPTSPTPPMPGGGGGGGSTGPTSPPPSQAAGMVGSTAPWLLGGAVLLGIVYFAATSKKKR